MSDSHILVNKLTENIYDNFVAKKTTIYDIARYLHVTPATVSYALNNVSKVSEEMRKKILQTAKELGYSRDYNAVSLSTGKTHLMVLFLPFEDISKAFLLNPFYGEFIGSFEREIKKQDYDLLIEPMLSEKDLLPWLRSRGVDAIALLGTYPKYYRRAFKTFGKPVVLVDVLNEHSDEYNSVVTLDEQGSYNATKYLIENGHRKIAFASGDSSKSSVDFIRLSGYKRALEESGIPFDESLTIVCSDVSFDAGALMAPKVFETGATAVVCAADSLAMGIMRALKNIGKVIPEDISIIGYDDISAAKYTIPALTTMRQDILEKARMSAKFLLDDIKDKTVSNHIFKIIPELVIRGTVKNLNE